MRVALYQNNPKFGDIGFNLEDTLKAVENKDFDLLVLPELFATGYQFVSRDEALGLSDRAGMGQTFKTVKNLAKKKQALIVYGFPEKENNRLFNSAAAVLPDGSYFVYQKTHLFDTEKEIFDPGETGFFVFDFNSINIGLMVCFDWRFPESARKLALLGAQIICHPANLVHTTCPDAMVTRALENMVFTITSDRVGEENRTGAGLKFMGRSRIVAPSGKVLAELGESETGYISVEIDPQLALIKKVTPKNDLFEDRRPKFY